LEQERRINGVEEWLSEKKLDMFKRLQYLRLIMVQFIDEVEIEKGDKKIEFDWEEVVGLIVRFRNLKIVKIVRGWDECD
jgi:hypothetical protein